MNRWKLCVGVVLVSGQWSAGALHAAPKPPAKRPAKPAPRPATRPAPKPETKPATPEPKPATPEPKPSPMAPVPTPNANPGRPARGNPQATRMADEAAALAEKGKFAEAAVLFQKAAELTPDDWALWEGAGWAHLDNGKPDLALKAFQAAQKASPPGTPVNSGLVVAQFGLGKPDEVLRLVKEIVPAEKLPAVSAVIKKGLAAKQFTLEWNYALAYLYSAVLRNSARALGLMEAVVKEDPKRAEAWLQLVEINRDLDQAAQEDAAAVKYLELAPDTPDAFRLRAERLVSLRQYPAAFAEYQAGIDKAPEADELYLQMARLHDRFGQIKEAEAVYAKLIAAAEAAKRPESLQQARAALAAFQLRRQKYPEAEKYYREAAQRPDATVATWETWGAALALAGKWEEAAAAMEGAVDRDTKLRGTTDPGVRDALVAARYRAAVCRVAAGQRDEAKAALEAAFAVRNEVRTGPELEAAAFYTWLTLKEPEKTHLAYQKSDERWAGFTWRQTQVDVEAGEREVRGRFNPTATAWRAILQQVQKANPNAWPADYALARIYAAAGYNDEGLELLKKAAGRKTDWWALQYPMGQYYAQKRDKENGVDVLRRTLLLAPECRQARVYLSLLTNLKDDDDTEP